MRFHVQLATIAAFSAPAVAQMGDRDSYHEGWHMMDGEGWPVFWIAGVIALVLLVALFAAMFWQASKRGRRSDEHPLDILEKRYARGEIDLEEFERRKRALRPEDRGGGT